MAAVPKNIETSSKSQPEQSPGPFLAKVVGHLDPNYMGGLEVEILRPAGSDSTSGQVHQVKYMSPFGGVTNFDHTKDESERFMHTQKSYGMWMIPPDTGTTVVIIFIDGDAKRGFWIGCVQDEHMNFMVPGLASTESTLNDSEDNFIDSENEGMRAPVAEFNKHTNQSTGDTTQIKKPAHPFTKIIIESGLSHDDIRGTTTSSARRETPSAVFGISTPGPLDKNSGALQGSIGKKDHQVNTFVNRLGGTTFVMDDGDDKFLRKTPARDQVDSNGTVIEQGGPPEYVSPEQEEEDGNPNIPHNELVRIRTRSGHQILLHNSEDLIYISHGSGNSWIEMTGNGKIDVFAKDSISFHTATDFNFHAGRDINFQAMRNINIRSDQEMQLETGTNFTIKATDEGNITIGKQLSVAVGKNFDVKANNTNIDGGKINLNSGTSSAVAAKALVQYTMTVVNEKHPDGAAKTEVASIMRRIPTREPYVHHENLDPAKFTPENTNRDFNGRVGDPQGNNDPLQQPPDFWKRYTTATDTFKKIKGASNE